MEKTLLLVCIAGMLLFAFFPYASAQEEDCYHAWSCTGWDECQSVGTQTRTCNYAGTCDEELSRPSETQGCEYMPPEHEEPVLPEEPLEPLFDVSVNIPDK